MVEVAMVEVADQNLQNRVNDNSAKETTSFGRQLKFAVWAGKAERFSLLV
jgi:hypothetical protein